MSDTEGGMFTCRNICWIAGALLGLVAFLLLNTGWFLALLIGVVLAVAVALLLQRLFCAGADTGVSGVTGGATGTGAAVAPGAAAAAASAVTAKPEVIADKAEAAAAESETVAGVPTEPEEPAVAEPAAPVVGEGDKPVLHDAPQGAADNLKLIKGVGPKLEQKLNALGVWHFSQIAAWSAAEIAWVDDQLSFRGRIMRDDWIGQAKTLAAGGETEFSARNK